jgi:hypothetical protein
MQRWDTTMLLCPAMRMMVNAFTPDSPTLVSIVWRRECITKSAGKSAARRYDEASMADIRETVLLDHMDTGRFRKRSSSGLSSILKKSIRSFVVFTGGTPLSSLYHAIYRAHVHHAVRTLKKLPGIHSIYITGGMAVDELQPGISDIDLTVNGVWSEAEQTQVIDTLKKLSGQSPLYDTLLSQCTQSLETLQSLYATDFYFQYLFDRGRSRWKLLYGEDIFSTLPSVPEDRAGGGYYMELRTWWCYFIKSAFGRGPTATDELFRNSIPFKAVAGVLMSKAFFDGEPPVKSRRIIMAQALERATGTDRDLIERLIASSETRHRHFSGDIQQEAYEYLIQQMETIHAELPSNSSFQAVDLQGVHIDGSASEMMIASTARAFIDAVVERVKKHWTGYRSAYLVPSLSFFYPDDLVLLLEVQPCQLPNVKQIRDLCDFALESAKSLNQRVALYLLLPHAAYQLEIVSVVELWHHTLCRPANPEVFAFLHRPEFVIDGAPRPKSIAPIWTRFAAALVDEEINIRRAAFSKAATGAQDIPSMELLRNLWRQLQLEIVQRSKERGFAVLPMTIPSIQRMLGHFGVPAGTILDELREAYQSELNGTSVDIRPLIPQLMALFAGFAPELTGSA